MAAGPVKAHDPVRGAEARVRVPGGLECNHPEGAFFFGVAVDPLPFPGSSGSSLVFIRPVLGSVRGNGLWQDRNGGQ